MVKKDQEIENLKKCIKDKDTRISQIEYRWTITKGVLGFLGLVTLMIIIISTIVVLYIQHYEIFKTALYLIGFGFIIWLISLVVIILGFELFVRDEFDGFTELFVISLLISVFPVFIGFVLVMLSYISNWI